VVNGSTKSKACSKSSGLQKGEHFSHREDRFQITSDNITNCNFKYTRPLPDLKFSAFLSGLASIKEIKAIVVENVGGRTGLSHPQEFEQGVHHGAGGMWMAPAVS